MLKDPVFEDVQMLLLSPYATEELTMKDLGGETAKEASEIKASLEWMILYRDSSGRLVSVTVRWAELIEKVIEMHGLLMEDVELAEQLRLNAAEDQPEALEESLIDVSPFSDATLYP
jgi:DNA-binding protein YbaB